MKYFFILISILAISCSPQKRLARLVHKHPELMQMDTIHIRDTFITKQVSIDTFFSSKLDSFVIVKDNITIKYIRQHDTIRISVTQPADTIIHLKSIPVQKVVVKIVKKPVPVWVFIVMGFLGLFFIITFINTFRK